MTLLGFMIGIFATGVVGAIVGFWVTESDPTSGVPFITGGIAITAWLIACFFSGVQLP